MKQTCPSPVTQDNFSSVWTLTDEERRRAKKKYVTSRIASFFSNMVFAALALVAGNGMIHDHLTGSYCDFLERIPYLLPIWEKAKALLLKQGYNTALQIGLTVLAIYAVCFTVCAVFVLLVTALYHPLKKKLPTASARENADQLLVMARDARHYANRTGAGGSVFWAFIFSCGIFGLVAVYWLMDFSDVSVIMELVTAPAVNLLKPYLTNEMMYNSAQSALFMPMLMLSFLAIYLGYMALSGLHAASIQFLYKYGVPYSFVAEIEAYTVFVEENISGLSAEEVEHLHRDQAADKRVHALELERMGAHGKAKQLLAEAAHGGDIEAMEHYARHWLIIGAKDPARFWLERCVASGQASEEAVKMLKRLKWRRRVQAHYLKETV